jgi:hypothetical protein
MGTLVEEMGGCKGEVSSFRAGKFGGRMEIPKYDTEWVR